MRWSKVRKGKKPIGWWYHKVLCEIGYVYSYKMYQYHLRKMVKKYKLNLYGEKI